MSIYHSRSCYTPWDPDNPGSSAVVEIEEGEVETLDNPDKIAAAVG